MNILIFTYDYPYKKMNNYTFVEQLVQEFAISGNSCSVIAPFPIFRKKTIAPECEKKELPNGSTITVYRPNFITIPFFKIGNFYPSKWLRSRAIRNTLSKLDTKADVVYCHFWNQGIEAFSYAKNNNIPLFVASGESEISKLTDLNSIPKGFVEYVKGVICVSTKNKNESIQLGLTEEKKCLVSPNAIDSNRFCVLDKNECRKKLSLPEDRFIVCFVGWFIERKGPLRVMEAIGKLKKDNIGVIYVGSGPQVPEGVNILFRGSVEHSQLKYYLNSADIFVLPTFNEGCCNAVIEAMACGLPIVSSDLPFNKDVLNEKNSILVNPKSVEEIAEAIKKLYKSKDLRIRLSEGAILASKDLTINQRAKNIINFIQSKIGKPY